MKKTAFIIGLLAFVLFSCSSDSESDVYISGKKLVKTIQKQHIYVYLDKPVTRIYTNATIYKDGKIIADTLTVTNYEYNPDSQFISKRLNRYAYGSNGKLQKEEWIGLDNSFEGTITQNYLYDSQDRLIKIEYENYEFLDSITLEYTIDKSILVQEFSPFYVNQYKLYVDAQNRLVKRENIAFYGSPNDIVTDFTYLNTNLNEVAGYSTSDSGNKGITTYNYLENRPIPDEIKDVPSFFFGQPVVLPLLYFYSEAFPSYAHQNLFVDSVDYNISGKGGTYNYQFSNDGYPIKVELKHPKNSVLENKISNEIEYIYE